MRGKVWYAFPVITRNRITPAYAGKSNGNPDQGQPEKGSPPPMRGKVSRWCTFLGFFGITPAYAGKSCTQSFPLVENQDHPRLCGEKNVTCIE